MYACWGYNTAKADRPFAIGVQAGAIYVDQSALEYFEELFKSADISKDDAWLYTRSAAKYFDKTTFEGPEQSDMRVRVGDAKLKMESPPIKMGNLKLSRWAFAREQTLQDGY